MNSYAVHIIREYDGENVYEAEVEADTAEEAEELARQEFAGLFVAAVIQRTEEDK